MIWNGLLMMLGNDYIGEFFLVHIAVDLVPLGVIGSSWIVVLIMYCGGSKVHRVS